MDVSGGSGEGSGEDEGVSHAEYGGIRHRKVRSLLVKREGGAKMSPDVQKRELASYAV